MTDPEPGAVVPTQAQEYRKTATITASQWWKDGDHPAVSCRFNQGSGDWNAWINTLEGRHIVMPGDWIATGVKGEHWPIKPDVFAASYELNVLAPEDVGIAPFICKLDNCMSVSADVADGRVEVILSNEAGDPIGFSFFENSRLSGISAGRAEAGGEQRPPREWTDAQIDAFIDAKPPVVMVDGWNADRVEQRMSVRYRINAALKESQP